MLRLSKDQLFQITGRLQPAKQASWFWEYLSVKVPCDQAGPVLTEASYEAILAKKLGVLKTETPAIEPRVSVAVPRPRPAKVPRAAPASAATNVTKLRDRP